MPARIEGEGEAARLIGEIAAQVEREGGWFNPDLVIRVAGSNVSMQSDNRFTDLRSMIRVPMASMPLVEDFDFGVSGGEFFVRPRGEDIRPGHVEIMERMVAVFNALGKAEQWRRESPWFSLAGHGEVLEHLLKGRLARGRLAELRAMQQAGEEEALLASTFMGSRKFNVTAELLKKLGHEGRETGGTVLMPIIDYFNHAMSAQGFKISDVPLPISMRVQARPHPETGELFVRYNVFDTLDTYLFYGFVDAGVGYLGSVPCQIRLGELTLNVMAAGVAKNMKLPAAIKDLRIFMPAIQKQEENVYQLSKLVVPGPRAPRALRRVLRVFLNSIGFDRERIPEAIVQLEDTLLEANESWWKALEEKAAGVPEGHAVHDLYRTALAHLQGYRERVAEME